MTLNFTCKTPQNSENVRNHHESRWFSSSFVQKVNIFDISHPHKCYFHLVDIRRVEQKALPTTSSTSKGLSCCLQYFLIREKENKQLRDWFIKNKFRETVTGFLEIRDTRVTVETIIILGRPRIICSRIRKVWTNVIIECDRVNGMNDWECLKWMDEIGENEME